MVRVCCVVGCPSLASQPSHASPRISTRNRTAEEMEKLIMEPDTYKCRKLKRDVIPSVNLPHQVNEPCEQDEHREPCESNEQIKPVAGPTSSISNRQSTSTSVTLKTKATLSPMSKLIYDIGKKCRRNVRLKSVKLFFLCKWEQQARRYAKTRAIQTLMNGLTPMQREIFEMQLRIAKYKPRVYKKMYLELAKAQVLKKREAQLKGLL